MTQLGVQLHTLRDLDAELAEIVYRVAEHGFDGVEFASRIHQADAEAVRKALVETGIEPVAAHVGLSQLESDFESLLDRYETVGCTRLVIPHISTRYLLTRDRVDAGAKRLNELAARLDERGFDLILHNTREMHLPLLDQYGLDSLVGVGPIPDGGWNHIAWALDRVSSIDPGGDTAFQRFVTATDADRIAFEIDVKHVVSAGRDPIAAFDRVPDRLPAIHVSDVARSRWLPPAYRSVDLGDGLVDAEQDVQGALRRDVDWVLFENDHPSDPTQALRKASEALEAIRSPDDGEVRRGRSSSPTASDSRVGG